MLNFYFGLIGSIWGSFIGLTYQRSKNQQSILYPRSHCTYCKETLRWWMLIPIFNYLLLRGKCFFCNEKFSFKSSTLLEITFALSLPILYSTIFQAQIIFLITFLLLTFISIQDMINQSFCSIPVILLALIITTNVQTFYAISIFLILLVLTFFDIQSLIPWFGIGDLEIYLLLSIIISFKQLCLLSLFASISGLIWSLVTKQKRIAFIPHLTLAFILVQFWTK